MRQQRSELRVVRADDGSWRIDVECAEPTETVYGTKDAATTTARHIARRIRGTLLIYGRNGKIQEVASYAVGTRMTL